MTYQSFSGRMLLVGASRGLGLALASAFLAQGWHVTATQRGSSRTALHDLMESWPDHIAIETLDITKSGEIDDLAVRLSGQTFDMLFVNAGITSANPDHPVGLVSESDFIQVMTTNAFAPMRVIETFDRFVPTKGVIGIMSSGQGSIARNTTGLRDLYRGSKAALNQFMRCYAARHPERSLALIAPGWVKTELGGANASLTIAQSIPGVVAALLARQGCTGLAYRDHTGCTVPW